MKMFDLNAGQITHLAFRPDGKMLGVCFHTGHAIMSIAELLQGNPTLKLAHAHDRVAEMAWHPSGRVYALAGAEGVVHIHYPDGYKVWEIIGLEGQHGPMTSLAFSADGMNLVLGGGWWDEPGRAVVVTDYYWSAIAQLSGHENQIGAMLFTGSTVIATGAADRQVIFHDFKANTILGRVPVNAHVRAMAVTTDGKRMAVAVGNRIEIWPLTTPGVYRDGPRTICRGHTKSVRAIAFSPDGGMLYSVAEDSSIRFWNTDAGIEHICLEPGHGPGRAVACSPDGLLVAFGGKEGKLVIVDAE